ncbi:unnamed protein product [Ectocarpus sp. 4 AP-2014]
MVRRSGLFVLVPCTAAAAAACISQPLIVVEMCSMFFEVVEPLDHATFLSLCDEVLRDSLLVLAPLGLPRHLREALGSEKEFIRLYGPRFRFILEAASDATYKERDITESQVAVTLHKLTEEEQNPEAMAYLARMGDSLREIYSPPRVLELPARAPNSTADLATIGSSLLGAGAVYTPGPQQAGRSGGRGGGAPLCDGTPPQPSRQGHAGRCSSSPTGDGDSSCAGENDKCSTAGRAKGGGGDSRADKGETGHDKVQRERVASCLSALRGCREKLEVFSDELEQAHIQALTEAFAGRYSGAASPGDSAGGSSSSSQELNSRRLDVAALDEFAAVPFLDHELFVLVRVIEEERLAEEKGAGNEKEPASGGSSSSSSSATGACSESPTAVDGDGETSLCERPAACLEFLLTSQAFRVRADESMERGLDKEAAASLKEANGLMEAFLEEGQRLPRPCRHLAELRAGLAKCEMRGGDLEAAVAHAEAALAEHPACGEAFLIRGQCRRELGDNGGALSDLVNAFVLQGNALNNAGDGSEAQAIEDVSRESCRARAGEEFSQRAAPNTLPADWVVRSFLTSYDTEGLYEEHDAVLRLHGEDPAAAAAAAAAAEGDEGGQAAAVTEFWQGLSLVREGKYAESIAKFSSSVSAFSSSAPAAVPGERTGGGDTTRIHSLALEYYGSFLYLMGDMDTALEYLRFAGEVDETNAKSWVKRGSVLSDLGRREEAFECFDAAAAIAPRDSDLFLHRGQGHLLANDFRKATADLRRSVELCTTMPISRAAWGVALFKLATAAELPSPSSLSKCVQVLEESRELFPENPEVLYFFAEVLISMGDFKKGLEFLCTAASLDPECPVPYVNAARAYLGMNDTKAARRQVVARASELDPTYPGTCLDLGQLLMQEGSPAEALSMYARGVEIARFPSELHDAMACLDVAKAHIEAQKLLRREAA